MASAHFTTIYLANLTESVGTKKVTYSWEIDPCTDSTAYGRFAELLCVFMRTEVSSCAKSYWSKYQSPSFSVRSLSSIITWLTVSSAVIGQCQVRR